MMFTEVRSSSNYALIGIEFSHYSNYRRQVRLDAGGKPSTWFPPGRLVEHISLFLHFLKNLRNLKLTRSRSIGKIRRRNKCHANLRKNPMGVAGHDFTSPATIRRQIFDNNRKIKNLSLFNQNCEFSRSRSDRQLAMMIPELSRSFWFEKFSNLRKSKFSCRMNNSSRKLSF